MNDTMDRDALQVRAVVFVLWKQKWEGRDVGDSIVKLGECRCESGRRERLYR